MKRIFLIIIFPIIYISCVAQQNIEADNVYVREEIYKKDGGTYEIFAPGVDFSGSPRGAIIFEQDGDNGSSSRLVAGIDGVTDDTLLILSVNNTTVDFGMLVKITGGTNPGIAVNNGTASNGILVAGTAGGTNFSSSNSNSGTSFYALHSDAATGDFLNFQKGSGVDQFTIDSAGQVHMYDTLFMPYFVTKPYSRFLHLYVDSITMSVKADSISFAASEALREPLKPLEKVLADTKDGEIKWGYYDVNKELHEDYGLDGTPRQVYGQLQRQIELNMRYIRGLEKQLAVFKWLFLIVVLLGGVGVVTIIFKK